MTRRRFFLFVRTASGILILVWLWRSGAVSLALVRSLAAGWPFLLVGLALFTVDTVLCAIRLPILLRARGLAMSLGDATRLGFIVNLFNLFLPGGGSELVRLYYVAAHAHGKRTEIATILLLDRLVGLGAMLLFPFLVLPLTGDLIARSAVLRSILIAAGAALAGMLVAFLLACSPALRGSRPVGWLLARLPLRAHLERVLDTIATFRRRPGALLRATALSLVVHSLSASVAVVLVASTHGFDQWPAVAFLALIGFLANNLPITPGGLGVGEAAFDSLFHIVGIDGGAEVMLAWRVLMLSLAPLGLAYYLSGRRVEVMSEST